MAGQRQHQPPAWSAGLTGRAKVLACIVVFIGVVAGGLELYRRSVDVAGNTMVGLALTGSQRGAYQLLDCRGVGLPWGDPLWFRCPSVADHTAALWLDGLLIAGYGIGLAGLCALGALLFESDRARQAARVAGWSAVGAASLDITENLFIAWGLGGLAVGGHDAPWRAAAAVATVKFVLLVFAAVVAVTVVLVVTARATTRGTDFEWLTHEAVHPPAGHGATTPGAMKRLGREPAQIGICVSGGGIRSACVTLGALQSLREHGILRHARYLVSVSGGGYTAGAFQLAMQRHPERPGDTVPDSAEVFSPTSPEQYHVRRHGKYIADSAAEWLVALGKLLRGALASLGLLAGLTVIVGMALGAFYLVVPIAVVDLAYPFDGRDGEQEFPGISSAATAAAAWMFAVALGLWFTNLVVRSVRGRCSAWLASAVKASFGILVAVVVIAVLVPALLWTGVWALWRLPVDPDVGTAVTSGAAGTVLVAYTGAIASILWRHRERIGGVRKLFRPSESTGLQARTSGGLLQRLVVWAVLLLLAALYSLLLGAVVTTAASAQTWHRDAWMGQDAVWWQPWTVWEPWSAWPQWLFVLVPLIFTAVALWVDQTWMSLHPFYRERLASAFAVRRRSTPTGEEAEAYDFAETTPLSRYGARDDNGFPQVIFAAAAQVSGYELSPPGRRAVSFTFSHDWIGGTQVGFARTCALEDHVGRHLALDLTLQSAVAVSGAAISSAMGSQSRAVQTLFAVSNARLGTWLPNPRWLAERRADPVGRDWRRPHLPRLRRITYLLREVLGQFDPDDRLVLVTDGGHYDNLGLVELLRHRCRVVYCIDASGDAPPLAETMGGVIALAREELGVEITLPDALEMVPGGGPHLHPEDPLADLSARLSDKIVTVGTITYPEPFQVEGEDEQRDDGTLVFAKTTLTGDIGYDLLSYAVTHPAFPYDSTADQWFDHGQFNSYHALGRYLGHAAAAQGPGARRLR